MPRSPIVRLGGMLIATVPEDLRDSDALDLQERLNATLETTSARGLLLDMSLVETLDSFLGRVVNDIAAGARLLGAATVLVGIQPAVAMTLVELGLEFRGVQTALTIEQGMARLRRRLRSEAGLNTNGRS